MKRATCRDVLPTLLFHPDHAHPDGELLALGTEWDTTDRGRVIRDGTWRSLKEALREDIKPEHRLACAEQLTKLADYLRWGIT